MVFGVTLRPPFAICATKLEAETRCPVPFSPCKFQTRGHSGPQTQAMHQAAPLGETATVAVAIRVRPLSASEHRSGAQVAWKHDEQKIWQTVSAPGGRAYAPATPYDFDRVYGAQTTTEQIHAESVSRSVARTSRARGCGAFGDRWLRGVFLQARTCSATRSSTTRPCRRASRAPTVSTCSQL